MASATLEIKISCQYVNGSRLRRERRSWQQISSYQCVFKMNFVALRWRLPIFLILPIVLGATQVVHSHSVSHGRFKRRFLDFLSIEYWILQKKVSSLQWLWAKGEGTFWINISRDHEFFFLSVVDSNTCDKIRTVRARITCNNARNIDLRYLKGY